MLAASCDHPQRAGCTVQASKPARRAQTIEESSEESEEEADEEGEDESEPRGEIEKILDARQGADGKEEVFIKCKGNADVASFHLPKDARHFHHLMQ